ncbi:hypothetical protein KY360_05590 [Candidatus Woesearchaeota archaeon]|nr:hypothetical protein [Candidatus Woesearchaeota archaeon]
MKRHQLVVLIICVALLSISLTLLVHSFHKIKHIEHIPMDVIVGTHLGMNIDTDALHFGMIGRNGCGNRNILVKHQYDSPVKVVIDVTGELEGWTWIEENDFILNKNGERKIEFKVCAPADAILGKEYTGTARIILKRL